MKRKPEMKEVHIGAIERRLTGTKCPRCGRTAEGGTALDDKAAPSNPRPDDFAVCLYCGALNRYTEEMKLRPVERTERRKMLRDPRLRKLVELAGWCAKGLRRQWQ